ncbi:MAG: response regulator [Gammaproteobacteria bacterium]|nr:response regulator [Gammaproteobacteria bacterium]MCW8924019.1 response regulator [Gammaproteobacteria bacterium]
MSSKISDDLKAACILVVDDELPNVKLLERMLSAKGFRQVLTTQDPCQVLDIVQGNEIDLILLDINMPKMDGYQVMEQLQSQFDGELPPILVLTAQHAQDFRQRALDNGARDYVTKPFDADELISRVVNLLEVHQANKYMSHENAILDERVKQRTKELEEAHQQLHESRLQVVRRLGRAAEYRDNETGLHIIRMSKMAALIAKRAGMSDEECDLLLNAAPMHDIGKIGIPDYVLLKPGKLDPDEWDIMKTHAQIGADILAGDDMPLLNMASDIALTHHEKWDGSGYPNGLKGEEIPLVGRITALADVFDALTSERPYKKAWSVEDAVALIKQESGKHFEPVLVEHFLTILDSMVEIKDQYAEPGVG